MKAMINSLRKKGGMACSEFHLIEDSDKIMLPIDADWLRLPLAAWTHAKVAKMPSKPKLSAVHFYSSPEPDPETKRILDEYVKHYKIDIFYVHHEQVTDRNSLYAMYIEYAAKNGYNKIAVPDSIEAMNAMMLATMCKDGVLDGPNPKQEYTVDENTKVYIIRPFCYCLDKNIEEFVKKYDLELHPGGITVPEENEVTVSRGALNRLYNESANININFFRSQFQIQEKYIGGGDGEVHELGDFEEF